MFLYILVNLCGRHVVFSSKIILILFAEDLLQGPSHSPLLDGQAGPVRAGEVVAAPVVPDTVGKAQLWRQLS